MREPWIRSLPDGRAHWHVCLSHAAGPVANLPGHARLRRELPPSAPIAIRSRVPSAPQMRRALPTNCDCMDESDLLSLLPTPTNERRRAGESETVAHMKRVARVWTSRSSSSSGTMPRCRRCQLLFDRPLETGARALIAWKASPCTRSSISELRVPQVLCAITRSPTHPIRAGATCSRRLALPLHRPHTDCGTNYRWAADQKAPPS